jgi:hypothetical protein
MGVVVGKISFCTTHSPYQLILDHCLAHQVPLNSAEPEFEYIDTQVIPGLQAFRDDGLEIVGQGCYVTGFKDDGYEITILGIPYPFYSEEFPHLREAYDHQFKA